MQSWIFPHSLRPQGGTDCLSNQNRPLYKSCSLWSQMLVDEVFTHLLPRGLASSHCDWLINSETVSQDDRSSASQIELSWRDIWRNAHFWRYHHSLPCHPPADRNTQKNSFHSFHVNERNQSFAVVCNYSTKQWLYHRMQTQNKFRRFCFM